MASPTPDKNIDHRIELHIDSERGGENAFIKAVCEIEGDPHDVKTTEVCPGVAVQTSGGHVVGVRLYPIPINPDVLDYEPLDSEATGDIAEITETLETVLRKLKDAA